MSHKLRSIIIDDNPMAIIGLKKLIEKVDFLELVATYHDANQALDLVNKGNVDAMFLDIEMPKISGLDFLKKISTKPITIITSSFPNYAIEGYELDVLDFLTKPISYERFLRSVNKAKEYHELKNNLASNKDHIFVKCERVIEKINIDDILYLESMLNYVAIHTLNKKYVTYNSLKNIEAMLPEKKFIKIQKSFIISISKIKSIETSTITIASVQLPISRLNREDIKKEILQKSASLK